MNKKYQVFISSTYVDLKEERQKVLDAVLALYQIPIGMEMFSAADEEQWEIIKSQIDVTDYYVLIIGNRYGSVIPDGPDAGISYTEKEFNYAVSQGVPVLAYLIDEDVPVKPSYVEKENIDKLKAFKKRVCDGREVVWWKTPDELATKVSHSLFKQISKNQRPGWYRANDINDTGSIIETTENTTVNRTISATENYKNEAGKNDILVLQETETKESDDSEKRVKEVFRIYLEEVKPIIEGDVKDLNQYPQEVLLQMGETLDRIAKYYIYQEKSNVESAHEHIIRAKIECLKYSCYAHRDNLRDFKEKLEEGFIQIYLIGDSQYSDDARPLFYNEFMKAEKCLNTADGYTGDNIQLKLELYKEALNALKKSQWFC